MARKTLAGNTLGEKHKDFNELVKNYIKHQTPEKPCIDYVESDVDNMLRIDIASHNRDVDFILQVLKSEDLFYVSRAIKRCTWLITDQKYSHIINNNFIHTELYPDMTEKAYHKLMLHIRLNLNDQKRVEEFYNYFVKKDDIVAALKWLPNCSLPFIEKEVGKHQNAIGASLLKRLCKISFTIFEIFMKRSSNSTLYINCTSFLVKSDTEKYLNIIESLKNYQRTNQIFNKIATKHIMNKCRNRIIEKFDIYGYIIDLPTFTKYLKKDDIKDILLKQAKSENQHVLRWFTFDRIKVMISSMPKHEQFEFVRQVFIDKVHVRKDGDCLPPDCIEYGMKKLCDVVTDCNRWNLKSYDWYQFAPFPIAFNEIKKILNDESKANQRVDMFKILFICAGRNNENIKLVLQYYIQKYMNDNIQIKKQVLSMAVEKIEISNLDSNTWNILDDMFKTVNVYKKGDDNIIPFEVINMIIIYKSLHNENIPVVVEEKSEFFSQNQTLSLYLMCKQLSPQQKGKIFNYLLSSIMGKLNKHNISNKTEFDYAVRLMTDILTLLKDWKYDLCEYSEIIEKIRDLIKLRKQNSWDTSLATFYNTEKSWRKYLFDESLILNPNAEVCLNALKHNPNILSKNINEVEAICCLNLKTLPLRKFLNKLRAYWQESLAKEFLKIYQNKIADVNDHRAIVKGLLLLQRIDEITILLKKYIPAESKINWDQINEVELSLQRQFAKSMHIARPQPSPEVVRSYAIGDYLQYALPSLHAIYYNLNINRSKFEIPHLWSAPVSLQKHGIRFAYNKMKTEDLRQAFSDKWTSSKNSTIRTVIFQATHNLLCKEKNEIKIKNLWLLMKIFMDNLTLEEDKKIYILLSELQGVHISVRGDYLVKSYRFLEMLIQNVNNEDKDDYERRISFLVSHMPTIMESMDPSFVEEIILEFINKIYVNDNVSIMSDPMYGVICAYVLCTNVEEVQKQRYEQVIIPLLNRTIDLWNDVKEKKYYIRHKFCDFLHALALGLKEYTVKSYTNKKVIPVKIFAEIETVMYQNFTVPENYLIMRRWTLILELTKIIATKLPQLEQKQKIENTDNATEQISLDEDNIEECADDEDDNDLWTTICLSAAPEFGEKCLNILKEDVNKYFSCIYILFAKVINSINIIDNRVWMEIYKHMLADLDFIPAYLVVINCIPSYCYGAVDNKRKKNLQQLVLAHPSVEVKIHYYHAFSDLEEND